jgi:hypothetical protein
MTLSRMTKWTEVKMHDTTKVIEIIVLELQTQYWPQHESDKGQDKENSYGRLARHTNKDLPC